MPASIAKNMYKNVGWFETEEQARQAYFQHLVKEPLHRMIKANAEQHARSALVQKSDPTSQDEKEEYPERQLSSQ